MKTITYIVDGRNKANELLAIGWEYVDMKLDSGGPSHDMWSDEFIVLKLENPVKCDCEEETKNGCKVCLGTGFISPEIFNKINAINI